MDKKWIILVILILLLGLVGFAAYYFTQQQSRPPVVDETRTLQNKTQEQIKQVAEEVKVEIDVAEVQDLPVENETKAVLKVIASGEEKGSASRSDKGSRTIVIVKANLERPQGQAYYEGWLVSPTAQPRYISLGGLSFSDDEFVTLYSSSDDLSAYDTVVVTLETTKDGEPEQQVLEGRLE